MRNHYIFKFDSKNKMFGKNFKVSHRQLYHSDGSPAENIQLAIYYANFNSQQLMSWWNDGILTIPEEYKIHFTSSNIIKEFIQAKKADIFWIFFKEWIIPFEVLDEKIVDNEAFNHENRPAKCRNFRWLKVMFEREEVPEIFGTTDTAGIMGTTARFSQRADMAENQHIGEMLLQKKDICISKPTELLRYLSPIQLETFFFKLFNDKKFIVSAYRGASKYHIDLVVKAGGPQSSLGGFDTSKIAKLQIKRTSDEKVGRDFWGKDIYFVTLSKFTTVSPYLIDQTRLDELLHLPEYEEPLRWAREVLKSEKIKFIETYLAQKAAG